MRNSGIVMAVQKTYAVVMTADGQFCRIPASPAMEIGMEVSWLPDSLEGPQRWFRLRKKSNRRHGALQRYGIVGLAASLMVAAGVWFASNTLYPAQAEAYAFVSVDINPSLLFQVDKNLKVVSFQGENSDGTELLSSLHLKGMNLANAMEQVIQEAATLNMLPAEDNILVASAPVSSMANVAQIQNEVKQDVKNAVQANPTAQSLNPQVYSLGLSETVWHAATVANVPPAKLAAYLIARDEGLNLTLAQLTGPTLRQVLSHANAAALAALSSSNLTVIEQFISQMEQSGLLTGPFSPKNIVQKFPDNQTTKPAPGRTLPSPVHRGQSQTPSQNQTPSQTQGQTGVATLPTVTIRFGSTSFTIQIGNPANDKRKKKSNARHWLENGQSNHGHRENKGDNGRKINQVINSLGEASHYLEGSQDTVASTVNSVTHQLLGSLGGGH